MPATVHTRVSGRHATTDEVRPILGITMGDPAGIGPEIIAKALASKEVSRLCRPIVVGSLPVMEQAAGALRIPLKVTTVAGHEQALGRRGNIPVLDPLERPLGRFRMGVASAKTGEAAVAFIRTAVRLAQDDCVDAVVTAPINKEGMHLGGYRYPGHTELLADLTDSKEVGMMIVGGPLKVMFVSTHVSIQDLPSILTKDRIAKAIRLAHRALREFFGIPRPRIGVAALNPHAGEGGLFGEEEREVIGPAARRARASGIQATDPLPADTLFGKAARGLYDGVVAMYHDQGLIPLKLVAFGQCVNVTVGLPIIRTSVDHGTAYDIAGKGTADPGSLIEAIKLAVQLARKRRAR
jgi:4-hydroxythreonine-4-phosphate dehydrogenase